MRPIEFKGMDINGDWHEGLLSISQGKGTQPPSGHYISNSAGMPWAYLIRPETIGQFIGLFDRNGKKIWEGNIVRRLGQKWVVTFDQGVFWFQRSGGRHEAYIYAEEVEVIGNVHDNPELLEAK